MQAYGSHKIGYLSLAGAACLTAWLFLSLSCGGGSEDDSVIKKTMEDLYYAYEEDSSAGGQADTSLTGILEIYSLDPEIFGDPVRIITEFEDSLTLIPKKRKALSSLPTRQRNCPRA
jgi:hypothetical protein